MKMCESTVFTTDGTKIMEDVISVKIDGNKIYLADILNQKKEMEGQIVEINLDEHKIYIQIVSE